MGATIVQGELDDHEKLVIAVEQVDVVISTVAVPQHLEQLKLIKAIKDAGNIKVNLPFLVFSENFLNILMGSTQNH
ncbi:hypothetical protein GBA52_014782 [Prunus armeniaca]|nr:hypothetical protein GBA52_014782 [Prunus armeniaca]